MNRKPSTLVSGGLVGIRLLALALILPGLAGCTRPNALDLNYGNSVRNNVAQQVVNPQAGFEPAPAVGLPPSAGEQEMERYKNSFTTKERTVDELKAYGDKKQ